MSNYLYIFYLVGCFEMQFGNFAQASFTVLFNKILSIFDNIAISALRKIQLIEFTHCLKCFQKLITGNYGSGSNGRLISAPVLSMQEGEIVFPVKHILFYVTH